MTILNEDAMKVSAALTDAFGAAVPSTEAGLEKEAGQTGIFIFSKVDYDLYLKNAEGAWTKYGSISGARESITVPWGNNTSAFFKCADADATIHVHRKEGDILYDTTPENDGDDQNTLLTSAGSTAQAAKNYSFPEADGNADQVLTTDGSGQLSWADAAAGGGGASTSVEKRDNENIILDGTNNGGLIIIEDFSENMLVKLPSLSSVGTGYRVRFHIPINNLDGILTIQTDHMDETIRGAVPRIVTNGTGQGMDGTPQAWSRIAVGDGVDYLENTLTMENLIAGSDFELCCDGNHWYFTGYIASWVGGNEGSVDFTKETF